MNKTRTALIGTLTPLLTLGLWSSAVAGQPFAETAETGDTLVVPGDVPEGGVVYYALTGGERQVYFTSDAPLEDITGQSNQVIGYAVASEAGRSLTGEWHLPVTSMVTGIELRDEHMAGPDWLDAASHPNIVFQLESVEDAELARETSAFRTYNVTLVGDMTIHGVTQPIFIPDATITFLSESEQTRSVAQGDLMAIRARYSVTLSDHEVSHPVIGDKVANEIEIDTALYLSTVPPSEQ